MHWALRSSMQLRLASEMQVTIAPREKYPLGQTVLKVNEQRERTHMFTRRYLEEQLYTVLAGMTHTHKSAAAALEAVADPCTGRFQLFPELLGQVHCKQNLAS